MKIDALIAATRPDPGAYCRAIEAFWHASDSRLFSGKFDVSHNEVGIGFVATFQLRQGRCELHLTPEERMGEAGVVRHTHLRRSYWLDAAWAQRTAQTRRRRRRKEVAS